MKIIHVSDTSIYNYDGISSYINELLKCAEDRNDEALMLTTVPLNKNKTRKPIHRVSIQVFPHIALFSSSKLMFGFPWGMKKIIEEFKPDLIWIHTIGSIGIAAAQIAKGKYPIIYSKHCFDGDLWCNHLKIRPFFQGFFQWAATVIEGWVVKPAGKIIYHFDDETKLKNHKYYNKCVYFSPPLNSRFFNEPETRFIKQDKLTLGFCGRCDPEKGLETLFEGFKIFQCTYPNIFFEVVLIGDGEVAYEMKNKFPEINTTITGFVDDVIPYLDQLDGFVFASKTETTSLASMEAYARNLKIFTTPIGFLGKNSSKYPNIFTFEQPQELADLIYKILVTKEYSDLEKLCHFNSSIKSYQEFYKTIAD